MIGVFPSKVGNPTVTGAEPALATLPAQNITDSDSLESATSAAIAQLESTAGGALSSPTL